MTGTSDLMPVAFIGHGSPMNAIERNKYTAAWRAFGQAVPRPRAILVVSAHWYINATAVTAMARPRTIHDFYGFPPRLFEIDYPAPGMPELVGEITEVAQPTWVGADVDSWGIDHGTWSVLVHAFPDASIPVVQLSINADKPLDYHLQLGAKLAQLRARGVLILGSGNIVHNLSQMSQDNPDTGYTWAQRFDEAARDVLTTTPDEAARLREHTDYAAAVPIPDHFIPMLYVAGAAGAGGAPLTAFVDGYCYGSLSMTSYTVGMTVPAVDAAEASVEREPLAVPADQSNI